ncbi:MAG: NUDIX domain-containing protein [Minisyncoccia bacterium]|jgi:8-oxo-dGTP pyrophosphatase MutT (NUDIX family)
MAIPKKGETRDGKPMHFSAGALILRDGKYLLIDRAVPPLGFAGVAGHVDEGEDEQQAVVREIREETGLEADSAKLLFEEELGWNWCSKGVGAHYWYLFECSVSGEMKKNEQETKSAGWYQKDEIKTLKLEPVWEYWFKKLNII